MSTYDETVNSCNRICPYCSDSYQVESEDYTDNSYVEECDSCGKKYRAYESFSVDHYAVPDCELNNGKHKWEPHKLTDGTTHDFCAVCNKCR